MSKKNAKIWADAVFEAFQWARGSEGSEAELFFACWYLVCHHCIDIRD